MSWFIDLFKEIPLSAALKEKLTIAGTRVASLEAENATLHQQLQQVKARIHQLEQEIAVMRNEKQRLEFESYKTRELPQNLEGIKEQLLIIVWCNREHRDYSSNAEIEEWLNYLQDMEDNPHYDRQLIDHFLGQLVNQRMLEPVEEGVDKAKGYKLREAGSAYFIDNNLQNTDTYRYLREANS